MHRFMTASWDHTAASTTPGWWEHTAAHWLKKAADPNGSDTQFEQAFSNLAHSYLRDKAPKLLDYEVGFQLIDKNEERTKAVGVLGFKLGEQWLYAPVFFLNGDLKGHDLLYIKNQDAFVPLKENWLNYLLGRKPLLLGESTTRNTSLLGVLAPSLQQLSRSPFKFAGHAKTMPEWAVDAMRCLARWATEKVAAGRSFGEFVDETGFETVAYMGRVLADSYPDVLLAVERFHPGRLKSAVAVPTPAFDPPVKKAATQVPGISVRKPNSRSILGTIGLSVADREKIAAGEPVLEDHRVTATAAYRTDVPRFLVNPNETGLYDVLTAGGEFTKCLIVNNPVGPNFSHDDQVTVVVPVEGDSKGKYALADKTTVWCVRGHDKREFTDWFDKLPAGELTGGTRLAVGRNGEATVPFEAQSDGVVDTEVGAKGHPVYFHTHKSYSSPTGLQPRYGYSGSEYRCGPPRDSVLSTCAQKVRYVFRQAGGFGQIHVKSDAMLVPNDYKYLALDRAEATPFPLGSLGDMWLGLLDTPKVKVRIQDEYIRANDFGWSMAKGAAVIGLVTEFGVSAETAADMIKQAGETPGKTAEFALLKQAYGDPVGDMVASAPGAPTFPERPTEWEPTLTGGVPAMANSVMTERIPGLTADRTNWAVYDPRVPDRASIQMAQQAANAGQKEVFDTAMLGTMLKVVRSDGMVNRYLGDLMKGLDRLGRILFLYYWHGDKFAERYGKQDMPEMEDSIRNAFENVGDVVLALKRKSIEPTVAGGVDVDLSDSAN